MQLRKTHGGVASTPPPLALARVNLRDDNQTKIVTTGKHTLRADFSHGFAVTDPFQCSLFTVHTGPVKSRQSLITGVTPALYPGAGGVKRAQAAENSLGGGQMADCRHWPGLASTQA